jgi:general secretion pathway protein A
MNEAPSSLEFFGLREQPFAATADPRYFYATRAYKDCLFRLWNNVDDRHGIAVVLGHYGTGKTTLLRKLLTGMAAEPKKYTTAVVASPIPSWTSFSLLEAIVAQFGLRPEQRSFVAYMEALNRFLLNNRRRVTTLIIDDAQNLNKRGQLELLRLVQNLETAQHKLLNLVFFAQLEWMHVLQAAPNFLQRVGMTYTLSPLSEEDTQALIAFRLEQAGAYHGPSFTAGAVRLIYTFAEGSPRVTINACRNALLVAAQLQTNEIGEDIVLHTIDKTTVPDTRKRARITAALQARDVPTTRRVAIRGASSAEDLRVQTQDERAARMLLNAAAREGI